MFERIIFTDPRILYRWVSKRGESIFSKGQECFGSDDVFFFLVELASVFKNQRVLKDTLTRRQFRIELELDAADTREAALILRIGGDAIF